MSQALVNIAPKILHATLACSMCKRDVRVDQGFLLTTTACYVPYPNKCRVKPAPQQTDACPFPSWTTNRPDDDMAECMTFVCVTCLRAQVVNRPKIVTDFTSEDAYNTMAKRTCTGIPAYLTVASTTYHYAVSIPEAAQELPTLTPLNIDAAYIPVTVCGGFMGAGPYGLTVGQYVSYVAPNFTVVPSFGVLLYVGNITDRLMEPPGCPFPIAVIRPLGATENGVTSTIVVPLSSVGPASNPVRGVLPLHYWLPDATCFSEPLKPTDAAYVQQLTAVRSAHMDDMMAIDKSVFYYSWVDDETELIGEGPLAQAQESTIINAVTYGALYEPAVGAMITMYKQAAIHQINQISPYRNDMVSPYGFYGVLHANATVKSMAAMPLNSVSKKVNAGMKVVFPEVGATFSEHEIAIAYDNTRPTMFSPPLTTRWTAQQLPTVAFGGPFLGIPDRNKVLPAFQAMVDVVWYQSAGRVPDSTTYAMLWLRGVIPPSVRWQAFKEAAKDVQRARTFFSDNLDSVLLDDKTKELDNHEAFKAAMQTSLQSERVRVRTTTHALYGVFNVQADGSVQHEPPMPLVVADMFVQHISNVLTDGDARTAGSCPLFNPLFKRYLHDAVSLYTPFIDTTLGTGSLHTAVLAAWNIYVAWTMNNGVCGFICASERDGGLQAIAPALCAQYFATKQATSTVVPGRGAYGLPDPSKLSARQLQHLRFEVPASGIPKRVVDAILDPAATFTNAGFYPVRNPLDMLYMVLFSTRKASEHESATTLTRAIWDLATKVTTSREDVCGLAFLWDNEVLTVPEAKHVMERVMFEAYMQKRTTGAPQNYLPDLAETDVSKKRRTLATKRLELYENAILFQEKVNESGDADLPLGKAKRVLENEKSTTEAIEKAKDVLRQHPIVQARRRLVTDLEILEKQLDRARHADIRDDEAKTATAILGMLKAR